MDNSNKKIIENGQILTMSFNPYAISMPDFESDRFRQSKLSSEFELHSLICCRMPNLISLLQGPTCAFWGICNLTLKNQKSIQTCQVKYPVTKR